MSGIYGLVCYRVKAGAFELGCLSGAAIWAIMLGVPFPAVLVESDVDNLAVFSNIFWQFPLCCIIFICGQNPAPAWGIILPASAKMPILLFLSWD